MGVCVTGQELPSFGSRSRQFPVEVRCHDLRHSVAGLAVLNGVPLPVVCRLLGHSNVRMTMRYTHGGDAEIDAAA